MSTVPAPVSAAPASAPRRHLSDVPFRFGPVAPTSAPAHSASADPVSLDAVLDALACGAGVVETNAGLRLLHANRRPELAHAVRAHERHVRAWNELALTGRGSDRALDAWPSRVRLYVAWLDRVVLPNGDAIQINPGVCVADRAAFRRSVQTRLELGPESASADALVSDLHALFESSIAAREATERAPRVPLARAA